MHKRFTFACAALPWNRLVRTSVSLLAGEVGPYNPLFLTRKVQRTLVANRSIAEARVLRPHQPRPLASMAFLSILPAILLVNSAAVAAQHEKAPARR